MKRSFYPNLDGYRGLAVILVLISHWLVISYFPEYIFLKLGFLGVNFFFVLSGFLITEILIIEVYSKVDKKIILKNFFAKRTLRIFPIYYLTILILAFFNIRNSFDLLPWTLTYTLNIGQNWFGAAGGPMFMHIWSLCVEEQFYLILPLVLVFSKMSNYLKIFVGFVILSIVFKAFIYKAGFQNFESINHSNLLAAVDALGVGSVLAYLKRFKNRFWKKIEELPKYLIIILALMFWVMSYHSETYKLLSTSLMRFTAACLGGIIIVKAVSQQNYLLNDFFNLKFIKLMGKISYGVYLYHWIISFLLLPYFTMYWESINFNVLGPLQIIQYHKYLGSFIFFFTTTLVVASLSYYWIEKPILKLKRYF